MYDALVVRVRLPLLFLITGVQYAASHKSSELWVRGAPGAAGAGRAGVRPQLHRTGRKIG